MLYGIHPVFEALKKRPRAIKKIHLSRQSKDSAVKQINELAHKHAINVITSSPQDLRQLTNSAQHQGVAAEAEPFPLSDIDDVITRVRSQHQRCFILVLDCVQAKV